MVDYRDLKKKFKAKKPVPPKKVTSAAVRAIQREYEMKKVELELGGAPVFRKGPLFYALAILVMIVTGSLVVPSLMSGGISLGKKRIERKDLMARKAIDSLTVALGRYKFHVGDYPTAEEGLGVLALKSFSKRGWDGPYVNHIVDDPWGNAYVYEPRAEGGNPVLYSKGADRRAGTTDDVMPEISKFEEPFRDTSWTNGWAPYRLRGVVVAPDEATKRRVLKEMKEYDVPPQN